MSFSALHIRGAHVYTSAAHVYTSGALGVSNDGADMFHEHALVYMVSVDSLNFCNICNCVDLC